MNLLKDAKLESDYSFMLEYSKTTVCDTLIMWATAQRAT